MKATATATKVRKYQHLFDQLQSLDVDVVWVNAARAREYLDAMILNRPINELRVAAYAHDMLAGRWLCTGDAIRVCDTGQTCDLQHRMHAVIKADQSEPGIEVPFLVISGVPFEAVRAIDTGQPRNVAQIMSISTQTRVMGANAMAAVCTAIVTAPNVPARYKVLSTQDRLDACETHGELAAWVYGRTRFPGCTKAVRAAIARACMNVGRDEMEPFCGVLASGVPSSGMQEWEYSAPLMLFRYLTTTAKGTGHVAERDRYLKTCSAIVLWRKHSVCGKLYAASEDPFQLPESG